MAFYHFILDLNGCCVLLLGSPLKDDTIHVSRSGNSPIRIGMSFFFNYHENYEVFLNCRDNYAHCVTVFVFTLSHARSQALIDVGVQGSMNCWFLVSVLIEASYHLFTIRHLV